MILKVSCLTAIFSQNIVQRTSYSVLVSKQKGDVIFHLTSQEILDDVTCSLLTESFHIRFNLEFLTGFWIRPWKAEFQMHKQVDCNLLVNNIDYL